MNPVSDEPIEPVPVDLPSQLAYAPGAAGGGGPLACGYGVTSRQLAPTLDTRVRDLNHGKPFLATSQDEIPYGGWITICYLNVKSGPVQERILGPDGTVIATLTYTLTPTESGDRGEMHSHDFVPLPTDLVGQYQVIATTVDGELSTSFRVTNRPLEEVLNWRFPVLRAVGRSASQFTQQTADLEYLYFARFQPNESIWLHFYAACVDPPTAKLERNPQRFNFSFSTSLAVGRQGRLFWRLPPNIMRLLDVRRGYMIVTQASTTQRDPHWGGPGDAASLHPYNTAPFVTTNTTTAGAAGSTPPQCPSLPPKRKSP